MYKEGDKVRFIVNDNLGIFSNKTGTIVKMCNDDDFEIKDDIFGSKHVYEIFVPFHGHVQVLDGFIKKIK